MLVSSKLLNNMKAILFILIMITSQGCQSEEKRLKVDSLQKPEELKLFVESGASKKNQKLAEKQYKHAVKKKMNNDWAAASKAFAELTLHYPTAKSLVGLSEAKANFYTQIRFGDKAAIKTLEEIEKYLKGAIAVDSIQKKMTQSETKEVNNDIACIEEFLKSRVKKDNCKYVNYVYQEQ